MKPFFVLIGSFIMALMATWILNGSINYMLSGNIALCVMLCFTSIGHFMYLKGMRMMLPPFIPFKTAGVYGSGILEALLGLGLLNEAFRTTAASVLVLFFIMVLPVNIYAASKNIDYQKGNFEGPGIRYLWIRIPLQLVFVSWTWYFGLYG